MPRRDKADVGSAARVKASSKKTGAPKKAAPPGTKKATPKRATVTKPPASKGLKTIATDAPTTAFFASLDAATRADCEQLDRWMRTATGSPGVMYGKAIVGYGSSTITYADGREAPWMKIGFSPRKQAFALYGVLGRASAARLAKLGKHDTGKGCLYIKRLADINAEVLQGMIQSAARA